MTKAEIVVQVFVPVPDLGTGERKTPIMASPQIFTEQEFQAMQRAMELVRNLVPRELQTPLRDANYKICSVIGACARWEREHG